MKNDRIYPVTRWLAAIIVPFLVAAFYILYLRTSETKELFAWEIKAPMSAMMLASAYIGGAYFFGRAVFARRWHQIGMGFLPVATFASLMAIATLLNLDRFNRNISFYTWEVLYFTTPFLVFGAWLWNRRTDPASPEAGDFVLPHLARYVIGAAALANLLISTALFLQPNVMLGLWPWPLTVLTARVISSMFALQGVFAVCLALDPRWSAARILTESQWVSMLFILIALWRTWNTLDQTKPFTWVFVVSIVAILAIIPGLYLLIEMRRRKNIEKTSPLK
jgi:hypothetical protein